jgi:hypothetical protein
MPIKVGDEVRLKAKVNKASERRLGGYAYECELLDGSRRTVEVLEEGLEPGPSQSGGPCNFRVGIG